MKYVRKNFQLLLRSLPHYCFVMSRRLRAFFSFFNGKVPLSKLSIASISLQDWYFDITYG